jgi:signal transduction histidine kinase/DNA-binding response OmpR family regulator
MTRDGKVNILLVDDQPHNLLALEAILGHEDLNLVRALSGEHALLRVLDDDFAAILMDVQMPGMDGFEAAELIRERDRSKHTPILFLTAFQSTEPQIDRGYALGAVDFLSKPIVPAVLKAKVAVFVELFQKTEQVKQQALRLVESQRQEHERELAEEKRRWEVERLRAEAAREKRIAEELARRADELTRSIAERLSAEEELAAVRDELAVQLADMTRLHALSERLSNSLELPSVLEEVLAAVTGLQGTGAGVLMLHDDERGELTTSASIGLTPDQPEGDDPASPGAYVHAAGGLTAIISGGVLVSGIESDPIFAPHAAEALRAGYRSVCSTPLLTGGGKLVGAIATYFPHLHRPTERETRLVELYAHQAAGFIDKARLYREIRESDHRKGEFLAMLAHELRNPLAPILNALHLIGLAEADGDEVEHARDVAERQVRHLARLVDDLLDVSRINSGKIELRRDRVDLREAVARAVEAARPQIEVRRHDLSFSVPAEPVMLEADVARLEQIFANLLNNAAKYTEPGGRITLEAGRDGGVAVVRVRDTGIGIDPGLLPHVFDMFTQADRALDRSQGGLGIGLTLVRRLVELHGGTVAAQSEGEGRGSEFIVRLPVTVAEEPCRGDVRRQGGNVPAERKRVLIVDDNADGARMLARLLRAGGHEVEVAYDGPSALDLILASPPDIVLLDIGLPGMDGYEVARRIRLRDELDRTLLVALTGYGQAEDRARALEVGFDEHLVKPVSPDDLAPLFGRTRTTEQRRSAVP